MATLLLKFVVYLADYLIHEHMRPYGLYFHRWLPSGEVDALTLPTGSDNATLKVWFERLGFLENGFIKFDHTRKEVDLSVMARQEKLDSGPLRGTLELRDVTDDEMAMLPNGATGDPLYLSLGKRVLKLMYPSVSRLINIVRVNHGQYWIPEVEKWDSRKESLGSHFHSYHMKWSKDAGATWNHFQPDGFSPILLSAGANPTGYIGQEDWKRLEAPIREGYMPSTSAHLLSATHRLLDQGQLKYALIEGVSSLELALSEYMKDQCGGSKTLTNAIQAFFDLPLVAQTVLVGQMAAVPLADVEGALEAITARNKVVHEGAEPELATKANLSKLMRFLATILKGPLFRFPPLNSGNRLYRSEK